MDGAAGDAGRRLLRIHDRDGRPRGLGFVVDPEGTVLTAHEAVAGLDRIVLHLFGGQTRVLGPDHVRPLPGHGLALLRTEPLGGLPVPPLPIAAAPEAGGGGVLLVPVPVRGEGAADTRTVLLRCTLAANPGAGCPQADRRHPIGGVLLLDVPSAGDAAAMPAGAPVLDAATGAVVAVVAPGLRAPGRPGPPTAVPAAGAGVREPELAEALARNAAGVPAYGGALNLAGVLRLSAAQLAAAGAGPDRVAALAADRVDRPDGLAEWGEWLATTPAVAGGGAAAEWAEGALSGVGGVRGDGGGRSAYLGDAAAGWAGEGLPGFGGGGGPSASGRGGGGPAYLGDVRGPSAASGGGLATTPAVAGDPGWAAGVSGGAWAGGTGWVAAAGVVALVGEPGSGRSTELAAVAVRRGGGERPQPTLWLRGADLRPGDASLAAAVECALTSAAEALDAPVPAGPGSAAAVELCAAAGRPLLVVLDGPEEAPVPLDADWLRSAAHWLAAAGARLLIACGPEAWERLAPGGAEGEFLVPIGRPALRQGAVRVAVRRLGPLPAEAADRVRRRYGLPPGWPAGADARHPLAVRLAGELWAEGLRGEPVRRGELFAAHLDLRCLRVAQRLAEDGRPRRPGAHRRGSVRPAGAGTGRVRRTAAAVAGRVHEAARRMLGAERGGLDRAAFEELFPVAGGWAAAVLAEGLFVPAGPGYRFAHGEFADWLQGLHLDLEAALRLLLGEAEDTPPAPADGPAGAGAAGAVRTVPRHRVGPVAAALRRIAETWGATALDPWLHRIWRALDLRPPGSEPAWWAGRLLTAGLAASPDLAEHRALLEQLAERIVERSAAAGGFERLPAVGPGRFGPAFWSGLGLPLERELALYRRLVAADGPDRPFLAAVAGRLRADPAVVLPLLCGWFDDPRGLPGRPGVTVADLVHDLLSAHRSLALDELTEALAAAAHPRADALLTVLAAEEPSALCRAVDRWSHDPRPERHVAAAVHALRVAPYARGAGAELLRFAALALLAREDEPALHGAALALLVGDERSRAAHLPAALAAYRRGEDRFLTARALAPALESDPEPVLAALADRLAAPSAPGGQAGPLGAPVAGTLRVLADARAPLAVRRGAELAARLLREHPELAGPVAVDYLGRRLATGAVDGAAARLELRVLLSGALAARSVAVRRPFAEVLCRAVPDPVADALRGALLDSLLAAETDPEVLGACLTIPAGRAAYRGPAVGARPRVVHPTCLPVPNSGQAHGTL
ncbi:S1C family serine protease [Kitasatospora sp. NPDC093806]|uniref:S1C family serine protease n=1 Tax=Kitasatospora sp. NPDC093806 TaxID=3155075 RepID=UPI003435B4D3